MSVARYPGNPNDFSRFELKRYVVQSGDAFGIFVAQAARRQPSLPDVGGLFFNFFGHRTTDHELGQFFCTGFSGFAMGDHGTLAHDGYVIRDFHDLAQFVRDDQNGDTLTFQVAQDVKQLVGFLRREYAGRLVQNEDVRLTVQGFEDFDTLLYAYGQLAYRFVQRYAEAKTFGDNLQFFARFIFGGVQ